MFVIPSVCVFIYLIFITNNNYLLSYLIQIVARFAFEKRKYAQDPDCDVDFETMR